jgi:hypothetical protein
MQKNLIEKYFNVSLMCGSLMLMLMLSGCPDKSVDPVPFPRENLVGSWKLTEQKTGSGTAQQSVYDDMPICITDNIFTYNEDGTYIQAEGDTKCESTDPSEKDTGTWAIEGAMFLYTDGNGDDWVYEIETLDATTFIVSFEIEVGGQVGVVTATYTKQ